MKVKFLPQNVECEIKPGQSVLHVAQDNNIHIKSVCRGVPSCAECRVRVVGGEHSVLPPSSAELALIGTAWFVDGRRLSCQLRCFGDITIDMTEQLEKPEGAGKKPRGRYNKDELQESRAVLGNLVMNDDPAPALKEDEDEEAPARAPQPKPARPQRPPAPPKPTVPVAATDPDGVPVEDDEADEGDETDDLGEDAEMTEGPGASAQGGPGQPGGKKRRRRRGRRGKRRGGGSGGAPGGGPPPS